MRLQSLNPDDPQHLVWVQTIMQSCTGFKQGQFYDRADAQALMDHLATHRSDAQGFVALDKESPVALAHIARHYPSPSEACISLLMVHAAHQRQHIGRHMLEQLSVKARHWAGIESWHLMVSEKHPGALAFWLSEGFTPKAPPVQSSECSEAFQAMTRPVRRRGKPGHVASIAQVQQQAYGNLLQARIR